MTRDSKEQIVRDLAEKFVLEFDNASKMHSASDCYGFYYSYNTALHTAVQLAHIAGGGEADRLCPQQFTASMSAGEKKAFLKLACTLNLAEAGRKKRFLIDWFCRTLKKLRIHSSGEIKSLTESLERIYERDLFWNLRDISLYNPACRPGFVFRSSTLTSCQEPEIFEKFMKRCPVTTIVDLRNNKEVSSAPYNEKLLEKFGLKYLPIPLETKTPPAFNALFPEERGMTKAYRWLAAGPENKESFKKFFTSLNPAEEVLLIHCNAGKDRTGALCALIALLAGENREHIEQDYLASESDCKPEYIRAFLETVEDSGGTEKYLFSCGIPAEKISLWQNCVKCKSTVLL